MTSPFKTSKVIIAIIIAVVVVLVVGHFVFRWGEGPALVPFSQVQSTTQSAIIAGDTSQCGSVNEIADGVNYETVCENNIAWNTAIKNLDINTCNGLDNKLMLISDCQNAVVEAVAEKSDSVSACNAFTGTLRAACVTYYWNHAAVAAVEPALCSNLGAVSAAQVCESSALASLIIAGGPMPSCSLFSGVARDDCNAYEAGQCGRIISSEVRLVCHP